MRSAWTGIERPLHFLAALSASSIRPLIWPLASTTMSQVRFAISPARKPALADSRTITVLRSGLRVQLAKTSRSPTSAPESIFRRVPGMIEKPSLVDQQYTTATQLEQGRVLITNQHE